MPKMTGDAKALQLHTLTLLFAGRPGAAYTTVELAERLGCHRRTVLRYLDDLSATGQLPLYQDEQNRWRLVENGQVPLPALLLDLREGAALYLAARLLAQQTDERNGHVISALDKLARAMPGLLATQLETIVAATATTQPGTPDMTPIFSALVLGWAHHQIVEVTYRPANAVTAFTCRFAPYLLEPSGIGRTIYVIGAVMPRGELRTFKLERVERTALLAETFTVPADFNGQALLARAWGVMYGDAAPVTVRLRFSKYVSRRVRETRWHPSQRIVDLPDGGCEWQAEIGDAIEIGPWVRGWGRDCEVLAPEELRAEVVKHVNALHGIYRRGGAVNEAEQDLQRVTDADISLLNNIFGS